MVYMKSQKVIRIPLGVTEDQARRLVALQQLFAEACNAISPVAQANHCWNRVALHHLVYKVMREKFASLGSQMICNAIYSVCVIYRLLYENSMSPFDRLRKEGRGLPIVRFLENTPVYFDRHTLSLKNNQLSMFTLDGRMRFGANLNIEDVNRFNTERLREITLVNEGGRFELVLVFIGLGEQLGSAAENLWPGHVVIKDIEPVQDALYENSHAASLKINSAR